MAQRHPLDHGLFSFVASRSHSDTPRSVGLLWTSDQTDAETSIWQHTTLNNRQTCYRRDSNPQSQQARREPGCRWRWVVSATPRPLYPLERDPVCIVQATGWVSGPTWTDPENFDLTGFELRAIEPVATTITRPAFEFVTCLISHVVTHTHTHASTHACSCVNVIQNVVYCYQPWGCGSDHQGRVNLHNWLFSFVDGFLKVACRWRLSAPPCSSYWTQRLCFCK
jgi:hypothetical protein